MQHNPDEGEPLLGGQRERVQTDKVDLEPLDKEGKENVKDWPKNIDLATGDEVAYPDGSKLVLEGVGGSDHRRHWKEDGSGYSCHGVG